ncbi:unnamed protein product, partial [marine sediment metagenome]
TELAAGNIAITYNGVTLTVEQSKAKILPQQALDILHNVSAVVAPTVTDDDAAGYSVASEWFDVTGQKSYVCVDDSTGAAVWILTGDTSGGAVVTLVSGGNRTGYATITLGLAAASSGDVVWVSPGSYSESVTVPAGVTLQAEAGVGDVAIAGALATGTRVTLSDGSVLDGFTVTLPTDALPAVTFAGAGATRVTVQNCILIGAGASGIGISKTGSGAMLILNVEYQSGTCDVAFAVSGGGIAFVQNVSISTGTISRGMEVTGTTTLILDTYITITAATITRGLHIEDACTVRAGGIDTAGSTTAVYIANSGPTVAVTSSIIHGDTYDIEVAAGASTGSLNFIACELELDKVSFPAGYLETATVLLSIQDEKEG